jgi:hypothetical protein
MTRRYPCQGLERQREEDLLVAEMFLSSFVCRMGTVADEKHSQRNFFFGHSPLEARILKLMLIFDSEIRSVQRYSPRPEIHEEHHVRASNASNPERSCEDEIENPLLSAKH